MSRTIAFVTDITRYQITQDDEYLANALAKLGWKAVPAIWTDPETAWEDFDLILFRSCWDYYLHLPQFESFLRKLQSYRIPVLNPLPLLQWNLDKFYLKELRAQNIDIIPTEFVAKETDCQLKQVLEKRGWEDVVIKPTVSAGSHQTWRFSKSQADDFQMSLEHILKGSNGMIQPFIESIQIHGEWSLHYFFGKYSHTVLKRPKSGEFRVQEQFGGSIYREEPSQKLKDAAELIVSKIPNDPIWAYARVDLVRVDQNYLLSELEMIEPSLHFSHDPAAANLFAQSIDKYFQKFIQ